MIWFYTIYILSITATGTIAWFLTRHIWRKRYSVSGNLRPPPSDTESKCIEELFQASELRYRRLFETARTGILILNAETGRIVDVNHFMIEILGFSYEQFQGKTIWDIGSFKDIIPNKDKFLELQGKEYVRYENLPLETADGRLIDVEFISNLYEIAGVKIIQCNIRDISARILADKKIKYSETRYRKLFETARTGILILDAATGMIVDVNPFMIEILGFSYEQFQGKSIWDIGPFKDIIPNKDKFLELQGKEYVQYENLPLETADGRRIDVEFVSNQYEIDNKKVIQCGIRDITARKQADDERRRYTEELKRSNQDLQQFAYVASHDLQEPLRMITSYLQLIERRYKDKLDADANDFIQFAVDGAKRLQSLIIGLLEYSRIGTHGKPFEKIEINNVIARVLTDLKLQISETEAVVNSGEMPAVTCDRIQMSRLFQNLIQNSIKFRRAGTDPVIDLSCKKTDNEYTFCVCDNGIGIEKEYYDRIFTIFQRLHSQDEYPGTGIGLSLSKRIVERHGGRIWIESDYGNGTSFYFTLPAGAQ
jgi:PAS domain S-box-containing protein